MKDPTDPIEVLPLIPEESPQTEISPPPAKSDGYQAAKWFTIAFMIAFALLSIFGIIFWIAFVRTSIFGGS